MFNDSKKDKTTNVEEENLSAEEIRARKAEEEKNAARAKNREMILSIATGGVCVALSYVLSLVKIYEMPQGGTITPASMLPIIFFCLCFGAKRGFCATFVYSLLQLIGGYLMNFPQVMLDYIIAFTAIGVAGFFAASLGFTGKTTRKAFDFFQNITTPGCTTGEPPVSWWAQQLGYDYGRAARVANRVCLPNIYNAYR